MKQVLITPSPYTTLLYFLANDLSTLEDSAYFFVRVRRWSEAEKAKEDEKPKQEEEKPKQSKPVTISKEEIDKQMKEREAAERKRVSKLARLYNEMKPQEAADAMADLDDDLTVAILQRMDEGNAAKTLAKMDAEKTARLTQIMYEGVQRKLTVPSETQQQPEE